MVGVLQHLIPAPYVTKMHSLFDKTPRTFVKPVPFRDLTSTCLRVRLCLILNDVYKSKTNVHFLMPLRRGLYPTEV
jgi:hypothetical protein